MKNLTIHLIRHGQSTDNARSASGIDIIGQKPDVPLSDLGKSQAFQLGQYYKNNNIDFIYSSPYLRALNTAEIFAAEIGYSKSRIEIVPDLREYSAGDWTGKNRDEVLTEEVKKKIKKDPMGFVFPGGESMNDVQHRAITWFDDKINDLIEAGAIDNGSVNIVLFSHGQTLKTILQSVLEFAPKYVWSMTIDNSSVSKISTNKDSDYFYLKCINDCSHLTK